MIVPAEDDVRFEPFDGFVGKCSRCQHHREVADEDASESRLVLNLVNVFLGEKWHLVDNSVDVVDVQLVLQLPGASVLEIIVESLHLRGFYHFSSFATDVVVARQVNCLDFLDFRENIHESEEISLIFEVISKRRLVCKQKH